MDIVNINDMMCLSTWKAVCVYEGKLVTRNWLFYLFIVGVFGYMLMFFVPWDMSQVMWWDVAFASSVPVRATYFLNLFQSLVVIFLVCDITRKRKRAECREVLSVRPLGNVPFFWGEFAGIFFPFLIVDVLFMMFCLCANLLIPDSLVNPWVYLSFLARDVLPTFVFVVGLSLLVSRFIRYPFLSWLVLVTIFYLSYAYLAEPFHGLLDFRGSLLAETFSTIVGFMHSSTCLLQRGIFLSLGIGLLCLAVPCSRRLSRESGRNVFFSIMGCLFLVLTVWAGYIYMDIFRERQVNRESYREIFSRYESIPRTRIVTHDITYMPLENGFSAQSRMTVVNRTREKMKRLILYLNPGLQIHKLAESGRDISFLRDGQAVVVERELNPGDSTVMEMVYGGKIDEDIYRVGVDNEAYFTPERQVDVERYGKRTAFVSRDYTLLIPEILWYPVAIPPTVLETFREVDFTIYTLHVKNPDGLMVLSQGIPEKRQDGITFRNLQALTGLSLCFGNYERRSVMVDSITVEFYTYPGNDFYMQDFDKWMEKIAGDSNAEEYRNKLKNECRDAIESEMPNLYPFKLLKIVEVPPSFLNSFSFKENVQPEMVFFSERMTGELDNPGDWLDVSQEDTDDVAYSLAQEISNFFKNTHAERLFSDFHWGVSSAKYPGVGWLFNKMVTPEVDRQFLFPSTLNNISRLGLEGLIQDGCSGHDKVISMKIAHLLAYLTTITSWDSLSGYMQEFTQASRFQEMDFETFLNGFRERFGQDIRSFVDEWYTSREIPRLIIKDIMYRRTEEIQSVDFKVGNTGNVDGVVSLLLVELTTSGKNAIVNSQSFLIRPGEYKRIVAHEKFGSKLLLSTNFSKRVPERITFSKHDVPLWKGELPPAGVTLLDKNHFFPPGEIIVDNEDEGFHLIDSSGNRLKRLAERLSEKKQEDYNYYCTDLKENSWGVPLISDGVYGREIHSAFVKQAGKGNSKAEWKALLPEAGKYEISVYRSGIESIQTTEYTYAANYPGMKNYYTVYTPEGKEEIVWEVSDNDSEWVSLGTFYLPAGESRVVLDDRGAGTLIEGNAQLIVVDAVKWVKVKN